MHFMSLTFERYREDVRFLYFSRGTESDKGAMYEQYGDVNMIIAGHTVMRGQRSLAKCLFNCNHPSLIIDPI